MEIVLIAAVAENGVIGKDNQLLWRLSNDLKRFKQLTLDHTIVMGRNTFASLGYKPLPGRKNVVLTRQNCDNQSNVIFVRNKKQVFEVCKDDEKLFIIGGGQVYDLFLEDATKLELTQVKTTIEGDTFFPKIDSSRWKLVEKSCFDRDEKNEYDYCFETYIKKD